MCSKCREEYDGFLHEWECFQPGRVLETPPTICGCGIEHAYTACATCENTYCGITYKACPFESCQVTPPSGLDSDVERNRETYKEIEERLSRVLTTLQRRPYVGPKDALNMRVDVGVALSLLARYSNFSR
jgi:hypothetical protein